MKSSPFDLRAGRRCLRVIGTGVLSVALLAPLSVTHAQSLADQTQSTSDRKLGPMNVIAVNPFLPLFGYFAGEYERSVTDAVSFAVSGSHIKPDNTRYTNLDFKVRIYPSERGLEGFNVAASLGVANIKNTDVYYDCGIIEPTNGCPPRDPFGAGAFAVELGYQWLLGPSKVMVVSVGGGAKRYLASESKFQGTERVLPTVRLTVGYAF